MNQIFQPGSLKLPSILKFIFIYMDGQTSGDSNLHNSFIQQTVTVLVIQILHFDIMNSLYFSCWHRHLSEKYTVRAAENGNHTLNYNAMQQTDVHITYVSLTSILQPQH
jgi:hypothetical protein